MQAFTAGVRQRWAVVGQQKSFWGGVVLTVLTIAFLRMRLPTVNGVPSDIILRLWGMGLQLIGAFTVVKDLTKTASDFGEGPSLKKMLGYFKAVVVGLSPINGSMNITEQSDTWSAFGRVATIHNATTSYDARITLLENEVKSLHVELDGVHITVAMHKREFVNELEARTAALRQTIGDLDKRLKDSLVGGFSMLSFGVYSLAIGIVLTSIPVELATLFRLGQLPQFG